VNHNIVLAGVGGQGLLALAAVIGTAAQSRGYSLKQSEVHGMAQRGGSVQSHLRYGDQPIYSDLIPEGSADLILSLEPMEALRYLPLLSMHGSVVTSAAPVKNIPDYPVEAEIRAALRSASNCRIVDAPALARQAGAVQCANMVMLGAASPCLGLEEDALVRAIQDVFASRGNAVVETNIRGFRLGAAAVDERKS
jgi:indolepyruvate ferredoxin oxidoreductase beta subunit